MVLIHLYRHFYSNPFMDGTPSVTGPGENSIYQTNSAAYILLIPLSLSPGIK